MGRSRWHVAPLLVLGGQVFCGPAREPGGPGRPSRRSPSSRSSRSSRSRSGPGPGPYAWLGVSTALGVALGSRSRRAEAVEQALGSERVQQLRAPLRPLVVAMGTRGDAEPGFRLAAALRDRGHVPLVVSLDAYKAVAERWNLDFRSCGLDKVPLSEEYLTGKTRADQVFADRGWYGDAWTTVGERIFTAAKEHGCDVIVTTSMGNTHCLDVAEKLNLLCFALKFCPDIDGQVPTAEFPPSGYPSLGPLNLLLHIWENLRTVAAVFRGGFIPRVIDFRSFLGLPSQQIPLVMEVPLYSEYRQELQAKQPSLYAFSTALADRPPEYEAWHFITGSFSTEEKPTPLASSVEDFLAAGDVVCVAFGSMTMLSAPFQQRAVEAARKMGRRVLVVDPESEGHEVEEGGGLLRIQSAPYSSLFPKCSLVVHHGGAGTFQDCVLANVPQLIAPVLSWSDQPFWASELQQRKLGVMLGEGAIAPSAEDWESAYAKCFESLADFRSAANAASERMRNEGGLETACQVLEDVLLKS